MTEPAPIGAIIATLPDSWRTRAALFERHGATEAARTLTVVADELEAAMRAEATDTLTLEDAHRVSGYTADRLGRMIRNGTLANVGRKHAPRVRRGDLPCKPGAASASLPAPLDDCTTLDAAVTREAIRAKLRVQRRSL